MPTRGDATALPGARAVARYVRTTPMKARRVVDLIRGLPAREALTVLQFAPQAASEPVYKVLASAIANAENNERLDPDSLLVREAYVDEGPTLKRFRPRAQGRAFRVLRRTCHITISVESVQTARPGRKRGDGTQRGRGAGKPARGTEAATGTEATKETAAKSTAKKAPAKSAAKKAPAKGAAKKAAPAKSAKRTAAAKATAETSEKESAE